MITKNKQNQIWNSNTNDPSCHAIGLPEDEGHAETRSAYTDCDTTIDFYHDVDIYIPYPTDPDDWGGKHYLGVAHSYSGYVNFADLGTNIPLLNSNSTVTEVYGRKATLLYETPTIIIDDFFPNQSDADWNSCNYKSGMDTKFGYTSETEREAKSHYEHRDERLYNQPAVAHI